MEEEKEVSKLLSVAFRYLGLRARTKQEIFDFLQKKSNKHAISQNALHSALTYLEEMDCINDKTFITEFIATRSQLKPKGRYVLTVELLNKGISQELIDEYFEENLLDENSLAKKALKKKRKTFQRFDKISKFKKASDFLRRRGFSYSIVKKTIEELVSEE